MLSNDKDGMAPPPDDSSSSAPATQSFGPAPFSPAKRQKGFMKPFTPGSRLSSQSSGTTPTLSANVSQTQSAFGLIDPTNLTSSIAGVAGSNNDEENADGKKSPTSLVREKSKELSALATLPAPDCAPASGSYKWTRDKFGGPVVKITSDLPGGIVFWRITWLRPNYTSGGCKLTGNSRTPESANFRIMPHKFGFVTKPSSQSTSHNAAVCEVEMNFPGIFKLKAWVTDGSGKQISPLTEEVYEVVKQSSRSSTSQRDRYAHQKTSGEASASSGRRGSGAAFTSAAVDN